MKALFSIHEIVIITSSNNYPPNIYDQKAVVLYKREEAGLYKYQVQLLETFEDIEVMESELKSTGDILNSLFELYEIVIVDSKEPKLSKINGEKAVIVTVMMSQKGWYYTVCLLKTGICWCAYEFDLKSTGIKITEEEYKNGDIFEF